MTPLTSGNATDKVRCNPYRRQIIGMEKKLGAIAAKEHCIGLIETISRKLGAGEPAPEEMLAAARDYLLGNY